jgi:excisionase family DNA binding protein
MEKELLTTKDAASYLDISTDQLYKLNSGGKIPSYRPTGGKVYYLKAELIEWVLSGRRATIKDIKSQSIKSLNFKNLNNA